MVTSSIANILIFYFNKINNTNLYLTLLFFLLFSPHFHPLIFNFPLPNSSLSLIH